MQLGIESYQTKLNLEQPNWDASDFPFKEDYTIVFKPIAVIYRDRDDNRKMMRINEVHNFSDETLTKIKEKLDFMVKDFKLFKFNKGMENRKWTEDDKKRSEDFIEDTLPILLSFTHCGNKTILRVIRIILVILPERPSETKIFHNEDENPVRANIQQALGSYKRSHKGVKASANSDIVYFFTSVQDGDPLQDDVRLCLADDLKKAQDHNQRQVNDESKDYYPKYMAPLPPREHRHRFLIYEGLEYTDLDIADFESRLDRIHMREVHRVPVFDFRGLPDLMAEGLTARMLMEHCDEAGVNVFTSRAWRIMFDIRGPLVHELILEFFSTFRFGQAILDLDTPVTLQFQLGEARRCMSWRQFILALGLHTKEEMQTAVFGVYWAGSARQIPDKGDLRDYWMGISSAGDFLGTSPSYTAIRDLILRLCHRLIAYSIVRRSQAPENVTVTNLFYLRGMDVDSVNVPYLLARYLRLFAAGRKSGAHISGGQFVARLAEHFGLLTVEILGGLTTWAWVSIRPERQPDAAAGPPTDDEDAPIVDEGGQADPTLVTLVAASATTRSCQDYTPKLMEASGQPYQAFDGTFRGSSPGTFHRRKASTSIA
ncbi:hypothetical protein Tco_0167246 [Tanacetum coccineum]